MKKLSIGIWLIVVIGLTATPSATQGYDLAQLGLGVIVGLPTKVDTDGNASTDEWLFTQVFTSNRIVVAVRPWGLCKSGWFGQYDGSWTLDTGPGRSAFKRLDGQIMRLEYLPHPEGC